MVISLQLLPHDVFWVHNVLCGYAPKFNPCASGRVPGRFSNTTRGISGYRRWGQDLSVKRWGCFEMWTGQWLSRYIVLRKRNLEVLSGCHLPIRTRHTESGTWTSRILLSSHWHIRNRYCDDMKCMFGDMSCKSFELPRLNTLTEIS